MNNSTDKPELESLSYEPPKPSETSTEPNQNLMIFDQINGCCEMIVKLLNQLIPKTAHVEDCITTYNAWRDNNLKHLKGAFE